MKNEHNITRSEALEMLNKGGNIVVAGDLSPQVNCLQVAIKYKESVYVVLSEEMPNDFCWAIM